MNAVTNTHAYVQYRPNKKPLKGYIIYEFSVNKSVNINANVYIVIYMSHI